MIRARMKAQTGNSVGHTSIEMIPKTNMDTRHDVSNTLDRI